MVVEQLEEAVVVVPLEVVVEVVKVCVLDIFLVGATNCFAYIYVKQLATDAMVAFSTCEGDVRPGYPNVCSTMIHSAHGHKTARLTQRPLLLLAGGNARGGRGGGRGGKAARGRGGKKGGKAGIKGGAKVIIVRSLLALFWDTREVRVSFTHILPA